MNRYDNETRPKAEAEAVAEVVRKAIVPQVVTIPPVVDGSGTVLLVPHGMDRVPVGPLLDERAARPHRIVETSLHRSVDSFVAHVNRFKDEGSAIFAHQDKSVASMVAVYDYHQPGGQPRWGSHRAHYEFPFSEEWIAWTSKAGKALSQVEFAELVEERLPDVAHPVDAGANAKKYASSVGGSFAEPDELLTLSRGLKVRNNQRVHNSINLSSGEGQINFVVQHSDDAGEPLRVPQLFLLTLRAFEKGAAYQVPVRLRYRVSDGKVTWSFELWRADRALENAIKEVLDKVRAETALPVYEGKTSKG